VSKDVEEQLGSGFNDPRRICRIDEGRGFDDPRDPRWDERKKIKKKEERGKRKEERGKRPLIVLVLPASRLQLFRVRIFFAFEYSVNASG